MERARTSPRATSPACRHSSRASSRLAFLGNTRLAYSVFARSVSEVRVRERGSLDTFPDAPEDLEAFTPELIIDQRVSDSWGGLTFAAPLGDRFGLGISTFVGVRNQRSRVQTTASLLASDNRGGLAFLADDFSYFHVRAAVEDRRHSTRLRQWRVGMAITTPSVKLFGKRRHQPRSDRVRSGFHAGRRGVQSVHVEHSRGSALDIRQPALDLARRRQELWGYPRSPLGRMVRQCRSLQDSRFGSGLRPDHRREVLPPM